MYTLNDIIMPGFIKRLEEKPNKKVIKHFSSTDKDINIDISIREPIFKSGYNYIFNFKFTNNIGVNLIELLLTDIDISILLDNIDFMLQSNQDFVMKTTSLSSSTVGDTFISIYCENVYINEYIASLRYFFKVFSYSNEEMKKILSFDITDNLEEFYYLLYLMMVAKEVMELHYKLMVGLIPLSETVHQLAHSSRLFIPIDKVLGRYDLFIDYYKPFCNPEQLETLERIEKYSEEKQSRILNTTILDQNNLSYELEDTSFMLPSVENLNTNLLIQIDNIKQNNYILPSVEEIKAIEDKSSYTAKNPIIFDNNLKVTDGKYSWL